MGMSLNEPEKPKRGWGCLQWGVVVGMVVLLGLLAMPHLCTTNGMAMQMEASSNARQIVGLLYIYATDHNGQYPDAFLPQEGLTANKAFREFFKEGLTLDESIFGSPESRFVPDKAIGTSPDFKQALEPGENHWMLVAGQSSTTINTMPVVLENAADAQWPPRWRRPESGPGFLSWLRKQLPWPPTPPPPGRTWERGAILVSRNDASVETVKLVEKDGWMHLPESFLKSGDQPPMLDLKLLNVERKQP